MSDEAVQGSHEAEQGPDTDKNDNKTANRDRCDDQVAGSIKRRQRLLQREIDSQDPWHRLQMLKRGYDALPSGVYCLSTAVKAFQGQI